MTNNTLMDTIRGFLGIRQEPPRNDFRNPIWSSDDEDDEDELYTRAQINIYSDPLDMHHELRKQMQDMFKSFGNIFVDVKSFFHDENFVSVPAITEDHPEPDNYSSNNLRDYYLKPGYHSKQFEHPREDIDLDGKISSHEISGLLKQGKDKGTQNSGPMTHFNGDLVPGQSFCQTVITTSITKPDGTIETRKIVKNGNEVIEESITSTGPDTRGPFNSDFDAISNSTFIYKNVMSELSSLFRNFY